MSVGSSRAPDWIRGTLVGAATLAGLTALKLALVDQIGRPTPFLLYFGAVLVAAWSGGMRAGGIVTVLSAALGYGLFISANDASASAVTLQLASFGVECIAIAWLAERMERERRSAIQAASEVRHSADKLSAALSGIDHGVTMQDATGRLVYANDAAAKISGFASPAELLAAEPAKLLASFRVYGEDGKRLPPERLPGRAILMGRPPREVVVRFKSPRQKGSRWSVVNANALRGEDGELQLVVNVFRDITHRRRQEEALRVSREWFETALRSIGDAVIATDGNGRITFVNPVAEALTGHSASEARGRPLADIFRIMNEESRSVTESPVDRVLREGVVVGLANHTLLVRKDGSEVAIDDSAAPIRGSDGDIAGVVLVFRDVTAERRARQRREFLARANDELASSLDYHKTLATVARLAVPTIADWCAVDIVEDGDLHRLAVTHVDPSKVEWVRAIQKRYPPDRNAPQGTYNILRTGRAEMLASIPPELLDAAAVDDEHREIIQRLQLRSYVGVPLARGGETFGVITLVMAESNRRYDDDDLAFAVQLADRASTAIENAKLYRAATTARAEAELANRSKDDFLAMLGHELRNPLAPILTALELMKLRGDRGVEREREIVERQVRSVVRLVDDLLDVLRFTRGRMDLERVPTELADIVTKALEVAQPLVESRLHELTVDVPRGLVVDADVARLVQVAANILNNAAKYTEPGGHIQVVGKREGDRVTLRIRDDGMGIADPMLPQIFDVFVQAPQAIDRALGGLGLGLTIVRSLVELHGGTVTATSEGPGRGSEFIVALPASSRVAVPADRAAEAPASSPNASTILIVDDNVDALELMALALRHLGLQIHTAADGHAALELAVKVKPDIALLDLGLPGIDGYELARALRALPGLSNLKLVAVTGYGQASDRDRTTAAGFSAHLVKPVELATIRKAIEDLTR